MVDYVICQVSLSLVRLILLTMKGILKGSVWAKEYNLGFLFKILDFLFYTADKIGNWLCDVYSKHYR